MKKVIVVGSGISGLSAALEAHAHGAEVTVLEKNRSVGGNSARSGGKLFAAGTELQKKHGIEDSPQQMADYLMEIGENNVDYEKLLLISTESAANYEWLKEQGVSFSDNLQELHPTRRPIRIHYPAALDSSDTELAMGLNYIVPLANKAKEAGITVLLESTAKRLLQEDGVVVGVEYQDRAGETHEIRGDAVILATGGFDASPEMLAKYSPFVKPVYRPSGNYNVGEGLIMAEDIGAKVVAGGGAISLFQDISAASLGEIAGLYVDTTGQRFMDESDFWFRRSRVLMEREQMGMFYITDQKGWRPHFTMALQDMMMTKADSLDELAKRLNLPHLAETVARYNALAKEGKDQDFGKDESLLEPINEAPFYALAFQQISVGSIGGLIINTQGEVLDQDDTPIPGLYGAGEVVSGDLMYKEYPGSGSSLAIGVATGRIAARHAAK